MSAALQTTAAAAIATALAGAGCRHAFGMPGGEVLVLLDALVDAGIDFTLCKHENAAGFMAEGSWQATGAPGILLTTIGPGLANGVNSIANAFQEQVPLIVLSGCIAPDMASRFTHQVIDQSALLAPITKAQFQVADGDAGLIIEKAIAIAQADPPGPVHVDLPDTLANSLVSDDRGPATIAQAPILGPGPTLNATIAKLRQAKRPLILAGIGAVLHKAGDNILALAESHQIPVITTYKAKGIIPETHPLCLGGHGLSPLSDKTILPLLRQSDCILALGYDPIEMRSDWIQPWDGENAIEICHAQVEHGMHSSALRFVGNVAAAAAAFNDELGAQLPELWPDAAPQSARESLAISFAPREKWGAHAVFGALDTALPDDATVTIDSGAHRILLSQMFHANRPGQVLQSAAFCTMGVAVPLAIGYKKASPTTPVVAVVGDAGLDMAAGDLATLRDMKLPLTIIVLVDNALTLIGRKQTAMGLPETGVTFQPTDFVALSKAYGGHGNIVNNPNTLLSELALADSRETFTLLACVIDKNDYKGAF